MFKRLNDAPIPLRLPVFIVSALLIANLAMSLAYYVEFRNAKLERTKTLSETIAESAKAALESWFLYSSENIDIYAKGAEVGESISGLAETFLAKDTVVDPTEIRRIFLDESPVSGGEDRQSTDATQPFEDVHRRIHPVLQNVLQRGGYEDLFLVLSDGLVAYSVQKRDDFATNLETGVYANSALATAFRQAMNADPNTSVFTDFEPYAPAEQAPASFMAQRIVDDAGLTLGVIAVQLSIDDMQASIANTISDTNDEIYLVSSDGRARSNATQPNVLSLLDPIVAKTQVEAAANGAPAFFDKVNGIRNETVSAYVLPVNAFGNEWSVVVELSRKETDAALDAFVWRAIFFFFGGITVSVAIGYAIAASITRPLRAFASDMEDVGNEIFDSQIDGLGRRDEIGSLSRSLQGFKDKLMVSRDASDLIAEKRREQEEVVSLLEDGLKGLAKGDLTVRLQSPFPTEYEALRQDFNATIESMSDLIRLIVENSSEIHARAEEISASSGDLSHRTENQAATLEQTAAALDELTSSVRQAAESASEVEGVVTGARKDTEESGAVVSEAVDAMSMIRKSSQEISQIIGVIDDIAFQTNLLSLNAGVEAARAGDAGRGFAVVASEVRALAQRSSEAAKQIKSLITSSAEQVENGVGLVNRTGDVLGSIISRVSDIDALITDIASGAREQSIGLGEINVGMSQLDQVTQQNAAMVEEATAAVTTLKNEAASLSQTVTHFRLSAVHPGTESPSEIIQFRSSIADVPVKANSGQMPVRTDLTGVDGGSMLARERYDNGKVDDEDPLPAVAGGSWKDF